MIGGYCGRRPNLACLWHAILGGSGDISPREILKMHTLGDAFSLICGGKIKGIQDRLLSGNGNKVMKNGSVDCFYCLLIFS